MILADLPTQDTPTARRFRHLWGSVRHHRYQAWVPYDERVGQDNIWGPASSAWHLSQARAALSALRREGYYCR